MQQNREENRYGIFVELRGFGEILYSIHTTAEEIAQAANEILNHPNVVNVRIEEGNYCGFCCDICKGEACIGKSGYYE